MALFPQNWVFDFKNEKIIFSYHLCAGCCCSDQIQAIQDNKVSSVWYFLIVSSSSESIDNHLVHLPLPSLNSCCCDKYHWRWWLLLLHFVIDRWLCHHVDVIGSERWNSRTKLVLLHVHVILIISAIKGDEQEFNHVRINLWDGTHLNWQKWHRS